MDIGFVIDAALAGLGAGLFLLGLGISVLIYWIALDKYAEWTERYEKKDKAIYDVDTVVTQLEEHKWKSGKLTSTAVTHNRAIDDAIEIVKKGGNV